MKRFIFILTTLCISCLIQAQTLQIENKQKQFTPVSPQAARLMQEIDYPINYSTGSINLTIPLHTIKTRDLSLPISLKCNTSGIKLGEPDGWITRDWTLEAEPIITREKRGAEDENGYARYNANFGSSRATYAESMLMGGIDEQPDVFYYRTLMDAGKFVFKRPESAAESLTYQPLFFPASGNKLIISNPRNKIEMKDTRGNLYVYGDTNDSREQTQIATGSVLTAWKAARIISPQKDSITFAYQSICRPRGLKNEVASNYDFYAVEDKGASREYRSDYAPNRGVYVNDGGYWLGSNGTITYYKSTGYTSNGALPNSYTMNGFEVDWFAQTGTYYPFPSAVFPQVLRKIQFSGGYVEFVTTSDCLNQINVYEGSTRLKTISFTYSRFSTTNERRLDKLTITDNLTNKPEVYTFTYDNSSFYGSPMKSIDYWGYPNGGDNPDMVPRQEIMIGLPAPAPAGYEAKATIGRGSREPNQACMRHTLVSITYPTGLKDRFTYELHKYKDPRTSNIKQAGGLRIQYIRSYNPDGILIKKREFKYGTNGEGHIWMPPYPELYQQHYTKEYRGFGTVDTRRYRIFSSNSIVGLTNSSGAPVMYDKVTEIVGDELKTVYYYNCYTNYSMTGSAGYVPRFAFNYLDDWKRNELIKKEYLVSEDDTERVRKEEKYSYSTYSSPGGISANSTPVGEVFDQKVLVYLSGSALTEHKSFVRNMYSITGNQNKVQRQINEKEYNYATNNHLSKRTTMNYGTTAYDISTGQPIQVTTSASDGSMRVVDYTYPYHSTTTVAQRMVEANELGIPLEETYSTLREGVSMVGQKVSRIYSTDACGYLPYRQTTLQVTDTETDEAYNMEKYTAYDIQGNVTEYQRRDGVYVTLLWGYNYKHLVAEIAGDRYTRIIGMLGCTYAQLQNKQEAELKTLFSALRSASSGMVTSYTWYTGRGLRTMTDMRGLTTEYSYDGMGRLTGQDILPGGIRQKLETYDYNLKN